jgi:DNA-binding NarL/FixJ family response regulator
MKASATSSSENSLGTTLNFALSFFPSSSLHRSGSEEMNPQKSIRVLIADDSITALRSVRDYLEFAGGFEIVGTATDGLHAVQLASVQRPDLVLLDLSMPRVNGLEAAEQIRLSSPGLRVIIFSELYGLSLADECRRHGADSFVHKSNLPDGLLPEIERLFSQGESSSPRPSDN